MRERRRGIRKGEVVEQIGREQKNNVYGFLKTVKTNGKQRGLEFAENKERRGRAGIKNWW